MYVLGAKYKIRAWYCFIELAIDWLEGDLVPSCVAYNDICHLDVLAYILLVMIAPISDVYGPKWHTFLRIFLRYVSSLLWRLGVALISSTDGRVFLRKHIAFLLTGQRRPNINMRYS